MPRVRSNVRQLRALPDPEASAVSTADLRTQFFTKPPPKEQFRQRFGRGITLARIEAALRSAQCGSMQDLTDLSRETIDTDPHLAAVLQKRFGAVSSLPWEVVPAEGQGVDRGKAEFFATIVRDQLEMLPRFNESLMQLAWALFDGRSALEIDWMIRPGPTNPKFGRVVWQTRGIGWIHPRRISFGPERELRVVDAGVAASGFVDEGFALNEIPFKFITWTPQLFGEYAEREGLSPRAMYWSFFKRFSQRERMILLELFGKPWRIVEVDEESQASDTDLREADDVVDGLGSNATGRMPRGTKLNVVQPQRTAGQIHQEVIEEVDRQISKLVLGQTGTTDGVAAGMNSRQALVMQDEQFMILQRDARSLAEVIEDNLTDAIVALNFGREVVDHAPRFFLRSDLPADRQQEIERVKAALDAGLWISRSEAYERAGFKIPRPEDVVIRVDQPPAVGAAAPPLPRALIVFPEGAPDTAEVAAAPKPPPGTESEPPAAPPAAPGVPSSPALPGSPAPEPVAESPAMAAVRLQEGAEPEGEGGIHLHGLLREESASDFGGAHRHMFELPDGTFTSTEADGEHGHGLASPLADRTDEDGEHVHTIRLPDGTELLTGDGISEHSHQLQTTTTLLDGLHNHLLVLADGTELESLSPGEFSDRVSDDIDEPEAVRTPGDLKRRRGKKRRNRGTYQAAEIQCGSVDQPDDVLLVRQPETVFGTPEIQIIRGGREAIRFTSQWLKRFGNAVEGKASSGSILAAAIRAQQELDLHEFARVVERRTVHGMMLGALDSEFEADEAELIEQPTLSRTLLSDPKPNFAGLRFGDAAREFMKREVISRGMFEQLSTTARQRAFTVAGVTSNNMLREIQRELGKQIAAGADLRHFRGFMEQRVRNAGFVTNDGHIETVFRTNVLGAYNSGRFNQMIQPAVLRDRPLWEYRAVRDRRTRPSHARLHGTIMEAADPFWRSAYPPLGYNCRCRIVSRRRTGNINVTRGDSVGAGADPGFTSGIRTMIQVPGPRGIDPMQPVQRPQTPFASGFADTVQTSVMSASEDVDVGQVNEVKFVSLTRPDGSTVRAVFKSSHGEEGNLRSGVRAGTYHLREEAVSKLDRLMGGNPVVPPAVSAGVPARLGGGIRRTVAEEAVPQRVIGGVVRREGSFHEFIEADIARDARDLVDVSKSESGERMWLVDLLTANTDRHNQNWLIRRTSGKPSVVAIDNGMAFGSHTRFESSDFELPALYDDGTSMSLNSRLHALVARLNLREVEKTIAAARVPKLGRRATLIRIRALQRDPNILRRMKGETTAAHDRKILWGPDHGQTEHVEAVSAKSKRMSDFYERANTTPLDLVSQSDLDEIDAIVAESGAPTETLLPHEEQDLRLREQLRKEGITEEMAIDNELQKRADAEKLKQFEAEIAAREVLLK